MRLRYVFVPLLCCVGCGARDGELLSQVFDRASRKFEAAAGGSTNQFAGRLRSTARPTIGLAERVETRLRWDRYLEDVEVTVESSEPGIVKVKGKVPDLAKKQRVLDLSRSTTGIKDVIDQLTLPKSD